MSVQQSALAYATDDGRVDHESFGLSPRMRQTLFHFLEGLSEKQVAQKLGISLHTVHVYTTKLYRHFGVDSRGALVGRFVPRLDEQALEHMIRAAGFRRRRIELKHWVRAASRVESFAGATSI